MHGVWFVLLILDFSIMYASFIIWTLSTPIDEVAPYRQIDRAILVTALAPLFCAQFMHSVILYNDLGWRIIIPSLLAMMAVTATVFSSQIGKSTLTGCLTTIAAIVLLAPSILAGARFVYLSDFQFRVQGPETLEGTAFSASPEMWKAVRQVTPSNEAVANNPLDLANVTYRPGNISWATLSQRRNCATTLGLLRSYAAQLTPNQASEVYNLFVDAFRGEASEGHLRVMKERYLCKTLVVTVRDGLWDKPALNNSSVYKLVSEKKGKWRIYR
ncbi:hypothetical protein [Mesorhizobium sp. M0243]|uniref:hypothetical protein n=1 Tax=Mesorhizobium sp. M0243 TaxID=2956925 RepID=UPI00333DCA7E